MTGYLGMDLPRFLALLRKRAWLIAAIVGAAFLLALVVSLLQPSQYEASADLLFGRSAAADIIEGSAPEGTDPAESATNLELAALDSVAVRVKEELGTPASVEDLRAAVSVAAKGESNVAAVTARWDTPRGAAQVANEFANQIVALRREAARDEIQSTINALKKTLAAQPPPTAGAAENPAVAGLRTQIVQLETKKAAENGGVKVAEPATPPPSRSSPKPLRNAVIAAFVALALAVFLVVVLARFDERVDDEDELAGLIGAPVLARIPRVRARRLLPTSSPYEQPAFLEAFEFLRLNLQLMGPEGGSLVLAVTSPAEGDGKTTVVSWLARSLALGGAEVTAVDLDMRKPELHSYLNTFDGPAEAGADPGNGVPPGDRDDDAGETVGAGRGRRMFTAEDITAGLSRLARSGGNARRAARSLKAEGRDISESTLRRWKAEHEPLYAELGGAGTAAAGDAFADHEAMAGELTQPTLYPHVRLLTAGDYPALPIGRERLRQLFAQLRSKADYVLADTVPVSTVAEASVVAAAADGVILVVDLERTRRRDLLLAKKQLDNVRADVRGIVLNRTAVERPPYVQEDLDDPLADEPDA